MNGFRRRLVVAAVVALVALVMVGRGVAQTAGGGDAPTVDSSRIAADGTAYVTRVVPVPKTISPEAQAMLARVVSDAAVAQTLEQRRVGTDKWQAGAGEASKKIYPANVAADTIAGVPVRVVTPTSMAPEKRDRVLINLHGGGFNSDSGSLTESIPMANLTGTKVIAVLYRLAPEHPYPAGLDDAMAVYQELLKTYKPGNIGIYGTSAGAILTAEVTAKLQQMKLPLPGATGVFSGMGDFSQNGDSIALFALDGFAGHLDPAQEGHARAGILHRDNGIEGSGVVSFVRGFEGISADAFYYQRARFVAERYDDFASRVLTGGRGCAIGGF